MSQSSGPPPPDEPIIGGPPIAPPPPAFPPQEGQAGGAYPDAEAYASDDYDDEYDADWDDYGDEPDDSYSFYDEYDEPAPARQPIFYAFVALAVIVGVAAIFFIFTVVRDHGGTDKTPTALAQFSVLIDSPQNNARVEVNTEQTFAIRAKSNEPLNKIALLVDGKEAASDDVSTQQRPSDGIYTASLKTTFPENREYKVAVQVTGVSGAQHESQPITIVGFEPVTSGPPTAKGNVVATVSARTGPGDQFDVVQTLNAGDQVTIVGKSSDGQWLVIQGQGSGDQQWVRAAAISVSGSLNSVPVVQPPAAPSATATNTPRPQATSTPTNTPALPDFVPGNASLIDGGSTLQVTVANIGNAPYQGPLVVAISGVTGAQSRVFNVNIAANGGTALDFSLGAPATSGGQVTVTVDPDGAVQESSENNNSTSFTVQAPVIQPTATPTAPPQTATEQPTQSSTPGGSPSATQAAPSGTTSGQ
ncbi:MAG TPA: CARDB domain-containing protein [Tepidiformaceae bacterium]|nr:CARDB domain-containing protein [Tepidiformaceae bacterium]